MNQFKDFEVRVITRKLEFGEYDEFYLDYTFDVWVNLTRNIEVTFYEVLAEVQELVTRQSEFTGELIELNNSKENKRREIKKLQKEIKRHTVRMRKANNAVLDWYLVVWTKTAEDANDQRNIMSFMQKIKNGEPSLYAWLLNETQKLIKEYQEETEKN